MLQSKLVEYSTSFVVTCYFNRIFMTNMPDPISVYDLLKEVFLIIEDGDREFFAQYELTVTRFYSMWHLRDAPGLTLRDLSDRMLCDKSNITRVVKGLERDSMIYREDHESDGRAYRLYLTEKGRQRLELVDERHDSYNRGRFDACLSDQDMVELSRNLSQLKMALTAKLNVPVDALIAADPGIH